MHALRDRLPHAEVVQLGAQLPIFIRGVYYEGWSPAHTPKNRKKGAFLEQVAQEFRPRKDVSDESMARAVLSVLVKHVSMGEMDQIQKLLPEEVRNLWPTSAIRWRKIS
jgi:uncharacterized protein (DUF2267 family)